jgi:hypothetical protein
MKDTIYHAVTNAESNAFTNHINQTIRDDKDIKNRLPISHKEIFDAVGDGIILW